MIFRENKTKIRRTVDGKRILKRILLTLAGILCFILGFFAATPVISLFT